MRRFKIFFIIGCASSRFSCGEVTATEVVRPAARQGALKMTLTTRERGAEVLETLRRGTEGSRHTVRRWRNESWRLSAKWTRRNSIRQRSQHLVRGGVHFALAYSAQAADKKAGPTVTWTGTISGRQDDTAIEDAELSGEDSSFRSPANATVTPIPATGWPSARRPSKPSLVQNHGTRLRHTRGASRLLGAPRVSLRVRGNITNRA